MKKFLASGEGCAAVVVIGVACLLLAGCVGGYSTGGFSYSDGHREGTVQKFSRKGIVWKTHEGELATNGWRKVGPSDNPAMSNVFEFSVDDPEVARQIESLHNTDRVRLHYKQYAFKPPWRGSSAYLVTRVERLGPGHE